jgi:hypothetical protein
MKLSSEQFAELTSSFNAHETPRKHERRRAARLELQSRVHISPIVDGEKLPPTLVTVCDFSARGMAFLHNGNLPAGQQFITELPRRSGGTVELLCTVVHCRPSTSTLYCIGAEFTCTLQPGSKRPAAEDSGEVDRIRETILE